MWRWQFNYQRKYFSLNWCHHAKVSLELEPGTFIWNGSNNQSQTLTLTDNTKLLLEYPKWNGLYLSDSGKSHPKAFDISPKDGDSDIYYNMEKAGVVRIGLKNKIDDNGKQDLRLNITNN